jgi:hypothetical protein
MMMSHNPCVIINRPLDGSFMHYWGVFSTKASYDLPFTLVTGLMKSFRAGVRVYVQQLSNFILKLFVSKRRYLCFVSSVSNEAKAGDLSFQ